MSTTHTAGLFRCTDEVVPEGQLALVRCAISDPHPRIGWHAASDSNGVVVSWETDDCEDVDDSCPTCGGNGCPDCQDDDEETGR